MLIQHCLELGIMIFRHNMSQFMYHHILYAWLRVLMGANLSPCKGALLIAIIPRAMPWEGTEKVKSTFRLKVNGGEIVVLPFFFCLT